MTFNANSTHGFGLPLLSQPSCSSQRNPFISSPVKAGVPLGSVLGPVLFLIFINYLSDSLENPFCLFADDSTLCHDIPHTSDRQVAASSLPWDLYKITSLPNTWNMSFNPDKSHTLAISHWKDCLATLLFIPSHCFIQHIKCSFPLSLSLSKELCWCFLHHCQHIYVCWLFFLMAIKKWDTSSWVKQH